MDFSHFSPPDTLNVMGTNNDDEIDLIIEKDFDRVQTLLINSAQQQQSSKKKDLGEKIFSNISHKILSKYFVKLFEHVHDDPKFQSYFVRSETKLHHLFAQAFFSWTLSIIYSKKKEKKSLINVIEETENDENESSSESTSYKDYQCPFDISDEDKTMIAKTLIRYEFPMHIKILTFIVKSLNVLPERITELVKSEADNGKASFSSLLSVLSETMFNTLKLWDDLLPQCLLLGKVSSTQIESYAAMLSEENRNKAREIILKAENEWQHKIDKHSEVYRKYTHRSGKPCPSFDVFRNNLIELMNDLKQQSFGNRLVETNAAIGVIKQSCIKRYNKQELNDEQLLDLIYNILINRPQIKGTILKILEKYNEKGKQMATIIKVFDPRRKTIPSNQFSNVNLYEKRDRYLSLPEGVKVIIVDKPNQLKIVLFDLKKKADSDYPYVGLDAEWSPYLSKSRASILQIALKDIVYIIDMDSYCKSKNLKELENFLNDLFNDEKLIKVGFKFTEDLHQLRGCSPRCTGLYLPKKLICIHKLFHDLIKSSKKEIGSLTGLLKPSKEPFVENPEILRLQAELDDPDFVEENPFKTQEVKEALLRDLIERDKIKKDELNNDIVQSDIKFMGLSAVCVRVLGKGLDKSEQCSAWDRRPLRSGQIRYAALDAYCMLIIIDKFIEWCKANSLDFGKLRDSQPPTKIPFPLFFSLM